MGGYIVVKSQFGFNGKKYRTGEIVELSDKDALFYISEKVVIPQVEDRLPNDSDGLFKELNDQISELKDIIEKQKVEISHLTETVHAKELKISNLTARRK
jgi:uncharacterized coiled-coil protein SlyX